MKWLLFLCHISVCFGKGPWVPPGSFRPTVPALSSLVNASETLLWKPQRVPYSNAEQSWPFWLGASPWQQAVGGQRAIRPQLPKSIVDVAPHQVTVIVRELIATGAIPNTTTNLVVEAWPTEDPHNGRWTMVYARYALDPSLSPPLWQFINITIPHAARNWSDPSVLTIVVPRLYALWEPLAADLVFNPFTLMGDLYADPQYANCVFGRESQDGGDTGGWIYAGWPPSLEGPADRDSARTFFTSPRTVGDRFVCRSTPQPAWFNDVPVTWKLEVRMDSTGAFVAWPQGIDVVTPDSQMPILSTPVTVPICPFPENYMLQWSIDVQTFSGELPMTLPLSNRSYDNITHKNAADPLSQLPIVFDWLQERYMQLGIETRRINFEHRNQTYSNLIAVLPGRESALPPLLFMDHSDTAYDEDVFAKTKQRVSAPGADDNGSALATLLLAARLLKALPEGSLRRTVWLTHVTGEEYPSDDLGVRHLISSLMQNKTAIAGVVLMDMIAWQKTPTDTIMQVSAAPDVASRTMARYVVDAVGMLTGIPNALPQALVPSYRSRLDPLSYLFNTDADTISNLGLPVVLLNEHLNWYEHIDRECYHTSCDVFSRISLPYAASTVRSAIEALCQIAENYDVGIPSPTDGGASPLVAVVSVVAVLLGAVLVFFLARRYYYYRQYHEVGGGVQAI